MAYARVSHRRKKFRRMPIKTNTQRHESWMKVCKYNLSIIFFFLIFFLPLSVSRTYTRTFFSSLSISGTVESTHFRGFTPSQLLHLRFHISADSPFVLHRSIRFRDREGLFSLRDLAENEKRSWVKLDGKILTAVICSSFPLLYEIECFRRSQIRDWLVFRQIFVSFLPLSSFPPKSRIMAIEK